MNQEEQKTPGAVFHLISELLSLIPKELRELIGLFGGVLIFAFLPVLVMGAVHVMQSKFAKAGKSNAQCWHLQEVDSRVFKVNACTGKTVELRIERRPKTSGVAARTPVH